jgi:hypothetical protein
MEHNPPHLITESLSNNAVTNNQSEITTQIRFYSKRPHTITKVKDNINMDTVQWQGHWMLVVNWQQLARGVKYVG